MKNYSTFSVIITCQDNKRNNRMTPRNCIIEHKIVTVIHFSHHTVIHHNTVALLEFTQPLYPVQEDAGPVTVNLRLALNSPSLAASLGANAIQAIVSSGGGSATRRCM